MKKPRKKVVATIMMMLSVLILGLDTQAATINAYSISQYGIASSYCTVDDVVGKWITKDKKLSVAISKDGTYSSPSSDFSAGEWTYKYKRLELTSSTGSMKIFYFNGKNLQQVNSKGKTVYLYHVEEAFKKPSTAVKKVSLSKMKGYWSASELYTYNVIPFTKLYVSVNSKGKMDVYMQKDFCGNNVSRAAKSVKLSSKKDKSCYTFTTKINKKVVKGTVYLEKKGSIYCIINYDGTKSAVRLNKSAVAKQQINKVLKK